MVADGIYYEHHKDIDKKGRVEVTMGSFPSKMQHQQPPQFEADLTPRIRIILLGQISAGVSSVVWPEARIQPLCALYLAVLKDIYDSKT